MDSKTSEAGQREQASDTHIDISLVDVSLSLSYEDRIDAHESARALMEDLREAGKRFYAQRPQGTA